MDVGRVSRGGHWKDNILRTWISSKILQLMIKSSSKLMQIMNFLNLETPHDLKHPSHSCIWLTHFEKIPSEGSA